MQWVGEFRRRKFTRHLGGERWGVIPKVASYGGWFVVGSCPPLSVSWQTNASSRLTMGIADLGRASRYPGRRCTRDGSATANAGSGAATGMAATDGLGLIKSESRIGPCACVGCNSESQG